MVSSVVHVRARTCGVCVRARARLCVRVHVRPCGYDDVHVCTRACVWKYYIFTHVRACECWSRDGTSLAINDVRSLIPCAVPTISDDAGMTRSRWVVATTTLPGSTRIRCAAPAVEAVSRTAPHQAPPQRSPQRPPQRPPSAPTRMGVNSTQCKRAAICESCQLPLT